MLNVNQIIPFVIGALLGSGAIWEYQKIGIEKQQLEISSAETTTQLRKELDALLQSILNINNEFIPLDLCKKKYNDSYNKAHELRTKLILYKQNFDALEYKLSLLEGREPRKIDLEFSPPCPPVSACDPGDN